MKTRSYMVIENRKDDEVVCVKYLGLKPGVPWREISYLHGNVLISYHSKGDFRDFRNHGLIAQPTK